MSVLTQENLEETLKTLEQLKEIDLIEVQPRGRSTVSFNCRSCNRYNSINFEEESTVRVYSVESMADLLANKPYLYLPVDEDAVESYAKRSVDEYDAWICQSCNTPHDSDEFTPDEDVGFRCPNCLTSGFEDPHDALMCCSPICSRKSDCYCLLGVEKSQLKVNTLAGCYCSDSCPWFVCTTCHVKVHLHDQHIAHEAHPLPQNHTAYSLAQNDEVKRDSPVGGPTSLPDAVPSYRPAAANPSCAMCQSEYCCIAHDSHKNPHRGCAASGG